MIKKEVMSQLAPGMEIKVFEKIKEGEKSRVAQFRGVILAMKHGLGTPGTMTVRNSNVAGVGVERIFPLHSPKIDRVQILKKPKNVRRAKLYFLRTVSRKKARRKLASKDVTRTSAK